MIQQYRENLESIFGKDYSREGLVVEEPTTYVKESLVRKENALKLLSKHKLSEINELPVQEISNNLISLSYNYDSTKYERVINSSTRELLMYNTSLPNRSLIVYSGYLGIKAFGGNMVVYDPRPNFIIQEGERSIFPTYDPIYSKTTKDEILQYVYTTEYSSNNVPIFPNFKIGDYVVNGAKYNPIYDKRNYRLNGSYDSDGNFVSISIENYSASLVESSIIDLGGRGAYLLTSDDYNKGFQDVYGDGVIYKVKGSGFSCSELTRELVDYNKETNVREIVLDL